MEHTFSNTLQKTVICFSKPEDVSGLRVVSKTAAAEKKLRGGGTGRGKRRILSILNFTYSCLTIILEGSLYHSPYFIEEENVAYRAEVTGWGGHETVPYRQISNYRGYT